jgi:hypothetical protein
VIWSFTFNSLAMLVLRWKYKGERGWKVPPNLRIGKREMPIGLILGLHGAALHRDREPLHQERGHRSGIAFAAAFFVIFTISERDNKRAAATTERR